MFSSHYSYDLDIVPPSPDDINHGPHYESQCWSQRSNCADSNYTNMCSELDMTSLQVSQSNYSCYSVPNFYNNSLSGHHQNFSAATDLNSGYQSQDNAPQSNDSGATHTSNSRILGLTYDDCAFTNYSSIGPSYHSSLDEVQEFNSPPPQHLQSYQQSLPVQTAEKERYSIDLGYLCHRYSSYLNPEDDSHYLDERLPHRYLNPPQLNEHPFSNDDSDHKAAIDFDSSSSSVSVSPRDGQKFFLTSEESTQDTTPDFQQDYQRDIKAAIRLATDAISNPNISMNGSSAKKMETMPERLIKEFPKHRLNQTLDKSASIVCSHCHKHFTNYMELAYHVDKHKLNRSHKCPILSCPVNIIGFEKKAFLRHHAISQHFKKGYLLPEFSSYSKILHSMIYKCDELSCGKCFYRKDSLSRHIKLVHNNKSSKFNKRAKEDREEAKLELNF